MRGRSDTAATPGRERGVLATPCGAVWCAGTGVTKRPGRLSCSPLPLLSSCSSPPFRPPHPPHTAGDRRPSRAAARPGGCTVPEAEAAASLPDLRGDQARAPGEGVRGGALQQGGGPRGV